MPLYEYACRSCGRRFEYLVREGRTPSCPNCASVELEKQLSVFAVAASGDSPRDAMSSDFEGSACGTCGDPRGPGSCAIH
jgi:putative FmdB family regulatory protein